LDKFHQGLPFTSINTKDLGVFESSATKRWHEGDVPNPFLNPIRAWQNYLTDWIEVNRNFYENAIKSNEQWLQSILGPVA